MLIPSLIAIVIAAALLAAFRLRRPAPQPVRVVVPVETRHRKR